MERLHQSWGWVLAAGILLLCLGVIATAAAAFTTVISVGLLGSLVALGGVVQIFHAFTSKFGQGLLFSLLAGILYAVVGFAMMTHPGAGAAAITLFAACFLMISGLLRAVSSLVMRFPRWGWWLLGGIVTTLLGFYIASTPAAALWLVGTFVGVELMLSGCSWMALAFAARDYQPLLEGAVRPEFPRRTG